MREEVVELIFSGFMMDMGVAKDCGEEKDVERAACIGSAAVFRPLSQHPERIRGVQ